MTFKDVKKWLPFLLIGLPLLWLGLYFWAWMARVGCKSIPLGECIVTSFGNWGGKVVMLGWVDTTLGAGMLAFAAGAFVWIAYQKQRRDGELDEARHEAENLRANLLALRQGWIRAHSYVRGRMEMADLLRVFGEMQRINGKLPASATSLVVTQGIITDFAQLYLQRMMSGASTPDEVWPELEVYTFVMEAFLRPHERLIIDGRYVHSKKVLVYEGDVKEAARLGLFKPGTHRDFIDDLIEHP